MISICLGWMHHLFARRRTPTQLKLNLLLDFDHMMELVDTQYTVDDLIRVVGVLMPSPIAPLDGKSYGATGSLPLGNLFLQRTTLVFPDCDSGDAI